MPLERSKSKEKKDKKDKKKSKSKGAVKTITKTDKSVKQNVKQSVVVNVGNTTNVKKKRGRPRKRDGEAQQRQAPPQQQPQFVQTLPQTIFNPPPPSRDAPNSNPPRMATPMGVGTSTLDQAIRRLNAVDERRSTLAEMPLPQQNPLAPPAVRTAPIVVESPRVRMREDERARDFFQRISSQLQDQETPFRALREVFEAKKKVPTVTEIIGDTDITAEKRMGAIFDLQEIARKAMVLPSKLGSIAETKDEVIRDEDKVVPNAMLRSHPSSTLGKKPTDFGFTRMRSDESSEPLYGLIRGSTVGSDTDDDVSLPEDFFGLEAEVYNPADSQFTSVMRPQETRRIRLSASAKEAGRRMMAQKTAREAKEMVRDEAPMDRPLVPRGDAIPQAVPLGESPSREDEVDYAVVFSAPSPTPEEKHIKYIFHTNKYANDFNQYMRSGAFPSESGAFDLRGRRVKSDDTYQRQRRTNEQLEAEDPYFRERRLSAEPRSSMVDFTVKGDEMSKLFEDAKKRQSPTKVRRDLMAFMSRQELADFTTAYPSAISSPVADFLEREEITKRQTMPLPMPPRDMELLGGRGVGGGGEASEEAPMTEAPMPSFM